MVLHDAQNKAEKNGVFSKKNQKRGTQIDDVAADEVDSLHVERNQVVGVSYIDIEDALRVAVLHVAVFLVVLLKGAI
jgi:hypothetical protein